MSNKGQASKFNYVDADKDQGFDNPILEKIKSLLIDTDPTKWRLGGDDLSPDLRVVRPRSMYEQVLVRDITAGSLVLHLMQPVTCRYLPGGYALTPSGPSSYAVEVRDKIFDADKVVDPRYADNQKGKRCDVVASGEIAKSLYIQVRETVRFHFRDKQRAFDEKVREMAETLLDKIEATQIEEWEKTKNYEKDLEDIFYITQMEGVNVEIGRRTKDWESSYRVVFFIDKLKNDKTGTSLARACFKRLEEREQDAQLSALDGVLDDIKFE